MLPKMYCRCEFLKCFSFFWDRVSCVDSSITADDGERVHTECSVSYSGPAIHSWHVEWKFAKTGQRISSLTQDSATVVKRVMTLSAEYPRNSGEYVCSVNSRRPAYNDNCSVQLLVRRKNISHLMCVMRSFQTVILSEWALAISKIPQEIPNLSF